MKCDVFVVLGCCWTESVGPYKVTERLLMSWSLPVQMTGIPMNCSIKLQLNLYIKQVSGIM